MKREHKPPLRKCLGCSEMKTKFELIRIVKNNEGTISVDKTGKKNGRGAYICKKNECFRKTRKARRLERAFSQMIPPEIYDLLESQLEEAE